MKKFGVLGLEVWAGGFAYGIKNCHRGTEAKKNTNRVSVL